MHPAIASALAREHVRDLLAAAERRSVIREAKSHYTGSHIAMRARIITAVILMAAFAIGGYFLSRSGGEPYHQGGPYTTIGGKYATGQGAPAGGTAQYATTAGSIRLNRI